MIKFWREKLSFMWEFAKSGNWALVWEEWKLRRRDLLDAEARWEEINRAALTRLLDALKEEEEARP